jgi:hypothetical protein
MFPEITADQQEYVAESLAEVLKKVG